MITRFPKDPPMKKVVTVSLGSSKQDFSFETNFLGHRFKVQRLGADDDMGKAWELMRRQQTSADAIGLGEVGDHYLVGQDTRINKVTQRLLNVVTRVPATTGATLRRLLQVRAVRYVQNHLGHYFNNNLVLFLSGMRNYDMAVAMSDYTPNLKFADALAQTGTPTLLGSLTQLELYAKGSDWALSGRPGEMLQAALSGFKSKRIAAEVAKSHVIVGTFHELKEVGNASNLAGKTVITSAVDGPRLAFFKDCRVNLVVDVSPQLFERVVGTNVIEAMILAALGKPPESVSDDDFVEIIDELEPAQRGVYGGVVGYFDFAGDVDLAIAIRTTTIVGGLARVQAGAGLVADSDPDREHEESQNKAAAPLRAVAVANAMRRIP